MVHLLFATHQFYLISRDSDVVKGECFTFICFRLETNIRLK